MKKVTYLMTWANRDGSRGERWLNCDAQTTDRLASDFCAADVDVTCVALIPAENLAW